MHRDIDEVEFIIFDTETTGLQPRSGDRIVEISAIKFKGKERLGVFDSLINPGREISPDAFEVNRISPEMLKGAPDAGEVIPKFLDFIGSSCLCSYNAGFDMEFLNNELEIIGRKALEGVTVVDVLKMARRLLPGLGRYPLWFVTDRLGISMQQKHRALSDVEITLQVFNKLKDMLKEKGISDYANFLSLFAINERFLKDVNNQKVIAIQEAIDLRVKLKIKYLSSSSAEVTERVVLPKEIKNEKERIYLVGYCYLRDEERSFRMDNILHFEIYKQ